MHDDGDDATFPMRLSHAIAARGLTLQGISERLATRGIRVSVSTLSYWRSGLRRPERAASLEALDALEDLLGLSSGDLHSRLGPPNRPGPPRAGLGYEELLGAEVARLFTELGFGPEPRATEVSNHVILDLRPDLSLEQLSWRGLWRADDDGVDRVPQVVIVDTHGDDPDPAVFTPVFGCRLGRVAAQPHQGRYAAELIFDRTLGRGETTLTEYTVTGLRDVRDTSFDLHLNRRMNELVIWVRVDPAAPALRYETYTCVGDEETVTPFDTPGSSGHLVLRGFGPGWCGIRWRIAGSRGRGTVR
ncbi:helix-turn-helix domain-containing protein [Nocardioides sp. LHG3406-4]|uniref:helix-turn-helix domain-containing protein n=1 Tax=Nocardioides sp. LHG3406-4 TaxID=2804575 RepID=UPI003CF12EC0